MSQSGSKAHEAVTVIKTDGVVATPSPNCRSGDRVGPYTLREQIGFGGMATVWAAEDGQRTVALKILPPELAANPDLLARFRIEAQTAAALNHPSVAKMLDCGEADGRSYIAFELVPGETLRQIVERRGPIDCPMAISILSDTVEGLEHAHVRGIVHRDVKPANIIIRPDGRAVLIDMGLARCSDGLASDGGVTVSGTTLGTFDYVSPEQAIDPRQADFRSDLYSLGCTIYHALTGRPPVPEGTAARKLHFHQLEKPVDPRLLNPEIPFDVACILSRLLAKDPAARYQTADELRHDILLTKQSLADPLGGSLLSPSAHRWPLSLIFSVLLFIGSIAILFEPRRGNPVVPFRQGNVARPDGANPDSPDPPIRRSASDGSWIPADGGELADLLREGETAIRLMAGRDYDLTNTNPVIVDQVKLVLESEPGPNPARIILPAQDDAVVFRDSTSVEIRNVVFRTISVPTEQPVEKPCGIRIDRVQSFTVTGCRFELSEDLRAGKVASIDVRASGVIIRHSLFPSGSVGVRFAGEGSLMIRESAFGPHDAAVDLAAGRGTVTLDHVTFMLRPEGGCAIERRDDSAYEFQPTSCLFAPGGPPVGPGMMMGGRSAPAVLRMNANRPISWSAPPQSGNAYGRVDLAHIGETALSFDRRAEIGWNDANAAMLPTSPWAEDDPIAHLADPADGTRAFRVRLDLPAVRRPREVVYGLRFLSDDGLARIYPGDWPPPRAPEFTDDPIKTWWPNAPLGLALPRNTARSLVDLIAVAKPGNTIEVRHDGTLAVPPIRWGAPGAGLTLRPAIGSKPFLVADESIRRQADGAIVDLVEGELTWEGLEFRIEASVNRLAIVRQSAGSSVQFKNCVITLDGKPDAAAAVRMTSAEADLMRFNVSAGSPKCRFEETLLRGRGQAVSLPTARPVQILITQSLMALEGSVMAIESSVRDAEGGRGRIGVSRSTFALTGSLLSWSAIGDARRGLLMDIEANANVFVAVGEIRPLIRIAGTEPSPTLESFVNWSTEKSNRYSRYGRSTLIVAFDTGGIDRDDWQNRISRESTRPANRLRFAALPATPDALLELTPTMLAIRGEPGDEPVGADIDRLPIPIR